MIALRELFDQHGLTVAPEQTEKLERYREILIDWNTRMDLTAVSEEDMAARHFLDSLLPLKTGLIADSASLIDVGTGAGFPGLALALARPGMAVTLLDAQEKRCKFLRFVAETLAISNVKIFCERAENAGRDAALRERFDLAAARAVAPANVLCEYLLPFVKIGGRALLWKGPAVKEELPAAQRAAKRLGGAYESSLPMSEENAHVLVAFKKLQKTLPLYPRKNGVPAHKPLGID